MTSIQLWYKRHLQKITKKVTNKLAIKRGPARERLVPLLYRLMATFLDHFFEIISIQPWHKACSAKKKDQKKVAIKRVPARERLVPLPGRLLVATFFRSFVQNNLHSALAQSAFANKKV